MWAGRRGGDLLEEANALGQDAVRLPVHHLHLLHLGLCLRPRLHSARSLPGPPPRRLNACQAEVEEEEEEEEEEEDMAEGAVGGG